MLSIYDIPQMPHDEILERMKRQEWRVTNIVRSMAGIYDDNATYYKYSEDDEGYVNMPVNRGAVWLAEGVEDKLTAGAENPATWDSFVLSMETRCPAYETAS